MRRLETTGGRRRFTRIRGEKIVPRPAEVDRALREMLASYPALRQTWQTAALWGEIDALRESCDAIQRMLDD